MGREQPSLGLVWMELCMHDTLKCEVKQRVKKGSWGTSQGIHPYYCA